MLNNVEYGAFHNDPTAVPTLALLIQVDSILLNLLVPAEVCFSFLCFPQTLFLKIATEASIYTEVLDTVSSC